MLLTRAILVVSVTVIRFPLLDRSEQFVCRERRCVRKVPTSIEFPPCFRAVRVVDVSRDLLRLARRVEREACAELVRQVHTVIGSCEVGLSQARGR